MWPSGNLNFLIWWLFKCPLLDLTNLLINGINLRICFSVYWMMYLWFTIILDPSHVIGLYPNLLPQEFRKQLEYPSKVPNLEGGELEKALSALQDYLTNVSRRIYFSDFFFSVLMNKFYNSFSFLHGWFCQLKTEQHQSMNKRCTAEFSLTFWKLQAKLTHGNPCTDSLNNFYWRG